MKRAYVLAAFGVVVGAFVTMAACSSGDDSTAPTPKDSGTSDTSSVSDSSTPGDDTTPGDETSPGTDTGTAGDTSGPPVCPTAPKTGKIAELRDPASAKKVAVNDGVKLSGVVATSIKFRSSGSPKVGKKCTYAVFVADANATFAPYSGIMVVSETSVVEAAADGGKPKCPADDLIPNDLKPGDTVDVTGTYTEFGPTATTCAGGTPPASPPNPGKQPQLYKVCAMTKGAAGTPVAPAVVTPTQIQDSSTELDKWSGGLVRVNTVSASAANDMYGAFPLTGSKLQVTDAIWYRGSGPTVAKDQAFTSITGLSYLDFCTWSLSPSQCSDMVPASGTVCPSTGDAGVSDAAGD